MSIIDNIREMIFFEDTLGPKFSMLKTPFHENFEVSYKLQLYRTNRLIKIMLLLWVLTPLVMYMIHESIIVSTIAACLAILLAVAFVGPIAYVDMQSVILKYVKSLSHEDQLIFCKNFDMPKETEEYSNEEYYDVWMYRVEVSKH